MNAFFPDPLLCALIAAGFILLMTTLGSAVVFFFRSLSPSFHTVILGLTSGIMLAACFWSLLNPAIELASQRGDIPWLVAGAGVMAGVGFLALTDCFVGKLQSRKARDPSLLLVLSITLHNIPEGLAVGVAFGALGAESSGAAFAAAFSVALGIGIQNIPEGAAVSLPSRKNGYSAKKSFLLGVLSGAVEPLAAMVGATLVVFADSILPISLAFAAGAMIYVIFQELIPEAVHEMNPDSKLCIFGAAAGFVLMMVLDVALG